jgi:phosphoglycolate phosphatase-like HAD superfamily hydrolase
LLTGIDAIVFEPAGVLYDSTLWWRWLLSLLTRLNPTCPVEHFERLWQREYLPAVQQGRRELAEAFEACLAASGYARCQIEELTAAAMVRRRELELEVHPLPGVAATLTRLRAAGFRLALTCDSTSRRTNWLLGWPATIWRVRLSSCCARSSWGTPSQAC